MSERYRIGHPTYARGYEHRNYPRQTDRVAGTVLDITRTVVIGGVALGLLGMMRK